MDRTCATAWAVCAIGLAVTTWAAVRTPRAHVILTEHHVMLPRAQPARINGGTDPSVTFLVTRTVAP